MPIADSVLSELRGVLGDRLSTGDSERAIHGEAKPEEARKLIEDGIPVAPLPFRTRERAN